MIVDANAELGDELGVADLLRLMDDAQIDRAIVSATVTDPFPPFPEREARLLRSVLRSPLRAFALSRIDRLARSGGLHLAGRFTRVRHVINNAALLEAVSKTSGRLVPFAVVTPHVSRHAARDVETLITSRQIAGAKAFAWYHALEPGRDLTTVGRLLERAQMPLILQLGANPRTSAFSVLLHACPKLMAIFSHGGVPVEKTVWSAVARDPRLFIDLSGPWLDARTARAAIRAVGAHKAIFGSNAPLGVRANGDATRHTYAVALSRIADLGLSSRDTDLVMGENMAQILDRARGS